MTIETGIILRPELNIVLRAEEAANQAVNHHRTEDFERRRSKNTVTRMRDALRLFESFLASVHVQVGDLENDVDSWQGIGPGLVESFREWMLREGYSLSVR